MASERSSKKSTRTSKRKSKGKPKPKPTQSRGTTSRMEEPETEFGEKEEEELKGEENQVAQDPGVTPEPTEAHAPEPSPPNQIATPPPPARSGFMSRFSKLFSRDPSGDVATPAAVNPAESDAREAPAPQEAQQVEDVPAQEAEPTTIREPEEQPETAPNEPPLAEPMGRPTLFGRFTSGTPSDEVTAPEDAAPAEPLESLGAREAQQVEDVPAQQAEPVTTQEPQPVEQQAAQPETAPNEPPLAEPAGRQSRFGRLFSRKTQQQEEGPQPGSGDASPATTVASHDQAFADSLATVESRESDIPAGEDSRKAPLQSEPGAESPEPQESLPVVPGQQEVQSTAAEESPRPSQERTPPSPDVEMPVPGPQDRQGIVLSQVQQVPTSVSEAALLVPAAASSTQPPAPQSLQQQESAAQAPQYNFVTTYPIFPDNPEVYAGIVKDRETGGYRYIVVEPQMDLLEKQIYAKVTRLLVDELEVDMSRLKDTKSAQTYLAEETKKLAKKYDLKITRDAYKKVAYYFTRDYIKLGRIEVLMNDPRIEDISCDGPRIPLFIWHRDYESIPTNVIFKSEEELNTFASKLAYVSGKHISIANPIVDASLPDGSRIQITYGKEVTRKGSTFTIRKFKGDPITIVDMLKYNTVSPELGAYLWYLTEKRMSLLVAGGTASGKTTTLNAISMFIPPDQKIVSVEDSVTGDSEILVQEGTQIRMTKIGPFIDSALHSSRVLTHRGHELSRPDDLRVLTCDDGGRVFWSRCTALIKHRVKKEFIALTTRTGKRIEVTADHSLFTLDEEGKMVPVSGRDLMVGSYIVAPRIIPHEAREQTFDLKELPDFPGSGLQIVANEAGGLETVRLAGRSSQFSIPAQIELNEDLAFLAGLWVADGFYDERSVGLSVGNKELRSKVERIVGGWGLHTTMHSDGVSVLINSSPTKFLFERGMKLTGDDYSRRVPDSIFSANQEVCSSFLRGYFSGDGDVARGEVEVSSVSNELLRDIQTLMLRFGITMRISKNRKVGHYGGVGTFTARITGSRQIELFARLVGFEQEGKQQKIRHYQKATKYYVDPIPLGWLAEDIRSARRSVTDDALKQRLKKGIKRSVVGRQTILDLAEKVPSLKRSRLYSLASSDLFFDQVVSIEKSVREEDVYDLSVPETGRFISNNLVCHNTPELNLSHRNWIQSISRGGGVAGEITLFDLLKAAMRQRPDIIIVGEVRGAEAFTLFQAIATGHGGLGTIHADSVEAAINRLTSEPMNVPKSLLGSTLDCLVMQLRIKLKDKSVRRMVHVAEIVGHEASTDQIVLNNAFKWDPVSDKYQFSGRSRLFDKITKRYGTPPDRIRRDLEDRKIFLKWLMAKNIRDYKDVSQQIRQFYSDKEATIERAKRGLEGGDLEAER